MSGISLVVTILRPEYALPPNSDDAAAVFANVVESMEMGDENAAHLIIRDDGTFECMSGTLGQKRKES